MKKRNPLLVGLLIIAVFCLCGCAKKCENCGKEIEKDKEIEIEGNYYGAECVEYCAECKSPAVKGSGAFLTYKGARYCKDCFAKKAYPVVLEDNKHLSVSITGYNDEDGMITVVIKNKSKDEISSYQQGESAVMDGGTKCIAETDGTHSFAYLTVPAKEELTAFCSFRKSAEEFDKIIKLSEGHTFEFGMTAYNSDTSAKKYWDTTYKVKLTPDMFGYVAK
ncbi:LIM domain-containing protein [Eubacterium sp. AB3007]|uniref:LIM domain-containing protein n=1 Tax=Eubacterium sp. AB3007 TaxID=1392487 RepID=UPI0004852D6D|nr:LIM domain-containing protein [Eubacterium sp. AB3007]